MYKKNRKVIAALSNICELYLPVIANDPVLDDHFKELNTLLSDNDNTSAALASEPYDNIIIHLSSELGEGAEDQTRLNGEQHIWMDESICGREYCYLKLKQSLEVFNKRHLKKLSAL